MPSDDPNRSERTAVDARGDTIRQGDRLCHEDHPDQPALQVVQITDEQVLLRWLRMPAQDAVEVDRRRMPQSPWTRYEPDGSPRSDG